MALRALVLLHVINKHLQVVIDAAVVEVESESSNFLVTCLRHRAGRN
jgi:hypothetical protein